MKFKIRAFYIIKIYIFHLDEFYHSLILNIAQSELISSNLKF